jgi:predicted XRE-type DNA-binding protein
MARRGEQRERKGGSNVFQDLGLPGAKEHLIKAQIVAEISRIMKGRKLTQAKAGAEMGVTQPEVSRMLRGEFREYSVERLLGFLTRFERDVEIVIRRRKKGGQGAVSVVAT